MCDQESDVKQQMFISFYSNNLRKMNESHSALNVGGRGNAELPLTQRLSLFLIQFYYCALKIGSAAAASV